ncbi:hypothetical protein JGU71_13125 [Antrihabitans sp. YC3-6]|uniref:Uncharacterized protein n=1 Tax=Antrihabitans stalagmiti TaxID=2799499 RepID=A0A934NR13_9NOCA|nr:hypothetical protein [Antrihabitans stalagmiti]MBJ8339831.1 hypothetical protein [Antrihabitans stalagmiti]
MLDVAFVLATCAVIAGTAAVVVQWQRAERDVVTVAAANLRLDGVVEENKRMAEAAADVADAVETTTAAVQLGTGIVQASHQAIASIPFEILNAIPATRDTSRIVRSIHDETAGGIYKAIFGANRALGNAFRDSVTPKQTPEHPPKQLPGPDEETTR